MNIRQPIMSLLVLSGFATGAYAGQDWDAARHQAVEQIAASEESRLQQQLRLQQRLQKRQDALNAETKQEQHQYRWQKRQQDRLGVSIHASNGEGHTTMSGKGPR